MDEDGRDILLVPLAAWLPEAGAAGAMDLQPLKCLGRTGLKEIVTTLGIPLEESQVPLPRPGTPKKNQSGPDRAIHAQLPHWHSWVRALGLFVWFIALVTAFAADLDWAMPVAAGALFLLPAADGMVRVRAWWRNRRHTWPAHSVEIKPSPAAGGATRRFLRTASVRVLPHDVVLTNSIGHERWLGRSQTHGVAWLVRLVAPTTGELLGVEFRDRGGEARVLLPWKHWFAGPQGRDRWTELVTALNVPVADERYEYAKNAKVWWQGHVLAGDARRMSPMEAKEAREETSWHRAVIGKNELLSLPLFSAVLLAGVFGDEIPAFLAGLLSAMTIVAALVPAAVSAFISRVSYDKPLDKPGGRV
ncbi:hypothetical protein ACJ6WF_24515 [Streptomyces sp. MMS24-I2-30]|uniref:hypothetical protein n=1 Tax=Streptomyces sp. MMS24-I2-30 TaxID=3351564 RepID=UPI003896EF07